MALLQQHCSPGATAAARHNEGVVLILCCDIGTPATTAVALGTHAGHAAAEHAQALASLQPEQAAHDGATATIPAHPANSAGVNAWPCVKALQRAFSDQRLYGAQEYSKPSWQSTLSQGGVKC